VFILAASAGVYSSGYSFRLTEQPDTSGLGYIVPSWLEDYPADIARDGTTLLLPVKTGKLDLLRQQLSSLDPSCLLFLRKLRNLTVLGNAYRLRILDEGRVYVTDQLEAQDGCLQPLSEAQATWRELRRYRVYTATLAVPPNLSESQLGGAREGVAITQITFAFPLVV
jgi:hypothetical protein